MMVNSMITFSSPQRRKELRNLKDKAAKKLYRQNTKDRQNTWIWPAEEADLIKDRQFKQTHGYNPKNGTVTYDPSKGFLPDRGRKLDRLYSMPSQRSDPLEKSLFDKDRKVQLKGYKYLGSIEEHPNYNRVDPTTIREVNDTVEAQELGKLYNLTNDSKMDINDITHAGLPSSPNEFMEIPLSKTIVQHGKELPKLNRYPLDYMLPELNFPDRQRTFSERVRQRISNAASRPNRVKNIINDWTRASNVHRWS